MLCLSRVRLVVFLTHPSWAGVDWEAGLGALFFPCRLRIAKPEVAGSHVCSLLRVKANHSYRANSRQKTIPNVNTSQHGLLEPTKGFSHHTDVLSQWIPLSTRDARHRVSSKQVKHSWVLMSVVHGEHNSVIMRLTRCGEFWNRKQGDYELKPDLAI